MISKASSRFAQYDIDDWIVRQQRGAVYLWALLVAVLSVPFWASYGVSASSDPVAASIVDGVVRFYDDMSNDFSWLFPLLFTGLVALGLTFSGGRAGPVERTTMSWRSVIAMVMTLVVLQLPILAVLSATRSGMAVSNLGSVIVASIFFVILAVEVACWSALPGLRRQLERSCEDGDLAKRARKALGPSPKLTRRRVVVVLAANILGIVGVSTIAAQSVTSWARLPFDFGGAVLASAVIGCYVGSAAYVLMAAYLSTAAKTGSTAGRMLRAVAYLMIGILSCLFILMGVALCISGDSSRGVAMTSSVVLATLSVCLVGKAGGAWSLGRLARSQARESLKRRTRRAIERASQIRQEIARRQRSAARVSDF